MHRTSMGPIVSASAALVAAVAFLSAGCTPSSVPTPKAVPTAATLEPASASVPAQASGNPVTETQLAQLWRPVAVGADKGDYTAWGVVVDAQTGDILLDEDAAIGHTPASTTKTLAAFSALKHLDPTTTLTTSTLLSGDNRTLFLDSEGDLLLGAGESEETEVSGRAGLQTLADKTAAALTSRGITSVTLNWRGTLFEGDSHLPAWDAQEVGGYEGHVGPMAIDAGRTAPGAYAFHEDAPGYVAQVFAKALTSSGVAVKLGKDGEAPTGGETLASVSSATMGEQLRWMLAHSDNTLADQYCRLAASAAGQPTTYAGAVAMVKADLVEASIPTRGMILEDCSGLSTNDKLSANTLVGVLKASYEAQGSQGDLIRLLPWADLVGTLSDRMTDEPAAGNVQAKTGALQGVTTLSGSVGRSLGLPQSLTGTGAWVMTLLLSFLIDTGVLALLITMCGIRPPRRDLVQGCMLGAFALGVLRQVGTGAVGSVTRNPLLASFAAIAVLILWLHLTSRVVLLMAAWMANPPLPRDVGHPDEVHAHERPNYVTLSVPETLAWPRQSITGSLEADPTAHPDYVPPVPIP